MNRTWALAQVKTAIRVALAPTAAKARLEILDSWADLALGHGPVKGIILVCLARRLLAACHATSSPPRHPLGLCPQAQHRRKHARRTASGLLMSEIAVVAFDEELQNNPELCGLRATFNDEA